MHSLSLNFSKPTDCKKLTISDNSVYDPNFPVENGIIEIKPPGQDCFYNFPVQSNWCSYTLNCQSFDLCCNSCEGTVIPDGNYEIRYSVDPNLQLMVEYNHFRVCQLLSKYIKAICNFLGDRCEYTKAELKEKKKQLLEIGQLIDFAVWAAEECLNVDLAKQLYSEAESKLSENGSNCPTC